jgi:hypothetical protein
VRNRARAMAPVTEAHPQENEIPRITTASTYRPRSDEYGESTMVDWDQLTPDQQCVLLHAVEGDYLSGVLVGCTNEPDWPQRVTHVPRMAKIIEDLVDQGLVELAWDADEPGAPSIDVPADEVHEVLHDAANWWSSEGIRKPWTSLAPTDAGLAVYAPPPGDSENTGKH